MNPCPCGFAGDERRTCQCTPLQRARYRGRLSGPLRDRIDLIVDVPSVPPSTLAEDAAGESSAAVRARVIAARHQQQVRGAASGPRTNAELGRRAMNAWCRPDAEGRALLLRAAENFKLSARGCDRVLKVARTLADLLGVADVGAEHVAEALQYRVVE
jgi:magnesium chelatase family protein